MKTPKDLWQEVVDTYANEGGLAFLFHLLFQVTIIAFICIIVISLYFIGEGLARLLGAKK